MSGYVPHQRYIGDCLQLPAQAPRLRSIFGPLVTHLTPGYTSRSLFTHLSHQPGARGHAFGASAVASFTSTSNGRRRGLKVDRTASHADEGSQPGATVNSLTQQNAPRAALDKSGGARPCTDGGTPTQAQDAESTHGGKLPQRQQEPPDHLRKVKTPQLSGGARRRPSSPAVARDTQGIQIEGGEAAQKPTGPGRQPASNSGSGASGKGGKGGESSDHGEEGGSSGVGKERVRRKGPSEARVGGSSPNALAAAQRQQVSKGTLLGSAAAQASVRVASSEDFARRIVGETPAPQQSKGAPRSRGGDAAAGDGGTGEGGGGGRSACGSGRIADVVRSGERGTARKDPRRGVGSGSAGENRRRAPAEGEQSNSGDSGVGGEPPPKRRRGLDSSAGISSGVRRRQNSDAVSSSGGEGSSSGRGAGGGSDGSGVSRPGAITVKGPGKRLAEPSTKAPGDKGAGASSRAAGTAAGNSASSQASAREPPRRTQPWGANAGRAAPARIGQLLPNHRQTNNGRIHSAPSGAGAGGGRGDPRVGPPRMRPPFRPGAAGAGARDRVAGGGAASAGGPAQYGNIWTVTVEPIKMGEGYPDMADFFAAVREQAASWHPLHISAAMNHMAKMWDAWSKQKPPPHGAAATATAGRNTVMAGAQAPPGASAAGDGGAATATAAASVAGGGGPDNTPEKTLRETMDILHTAFLPHIRTINNSRYAMNALWVCAKIGYWGAPESTVVPAILQRLRQDSYAIMARSNGQAHGNLWWALSQYDQQMGEGVPRTRCFWTSAVQLPGRSSSEGTPGSAAMKGGGGAGGGNKAEKSAAAAVAAGSRGGGGGGRAAVGGDGGGGRPNKAAAAAGGTADSDRAATAVEPVTVPGAAAAGGRAAAAAAAAVSAPAPTAPVAGGMDILKASASVILSQAVLSEESYKPQEFSNIILAAARLGYSSNPRFIAHLLTHMVKHPGPFKPQAIANTIYALSELYGDEVTSGTHVSEIAEEEDAAQGPAAGGGAAKDAPGRLPPGLATHLRALAGLALRLGLHQFNPQELSNMVYGMARLGFKMDSRAVGIEWSGEWEEEEEPDEAAGQTSAAPLPVASPSAAPESAEPRSTADGTRPQDPEQQSRQEGFGQQQKHEQQEEQREQEAGEQRPSAAASSAGHLNVLGQEDGVGASLPLRADDVGIRHFVCRVAEHFRDRLQGFLQGSLPTRMVPMESMSISLTSWSLASIGYVDQSYYATIVQAALRGGLMDRATPQEWGLYLWALGNHGHQPPRELVRRLYDSANRMTPTAGDTDGWIMMPWAFAVLDLYDEATVSWVCGILSRTRIDTLEPQGLANCLWSLATMPEGALARHAELTVALVEAANRRRPQDFRLIGRVQLWQVHIELEAIINGGLSTTDGGDPAAGCAAAPTQQQAAKRRGRRPRKADASGAACDSADAAASASDHAPVQQQQPRAVTLPRLGAGLVDAGFEALMKLNRRHSENKRTSLQTSVYRLLRAMMLAQAAQPQLQDGWRPRRRRRAPSGSASASSSLDEDATDDEDATTAPSAPDGAVRRRVVRRGSPSAAASAGNGPRDGGGGGRRSPVVIGRIEQEWLVEPLGVRVDLCVWLSNGRQVVVEVDGPSHFFRNQPKTPLPNTALRDRQLSRVFGQSNVLTVPYFDWDAAGSAEIRISYLARLLGL